MPTSRLPRSPLSHLSLVLALCLSGLSSGASKLPNIVFFFADDQGTDTLGCYGNEVIQTPNIDRLAEGGIRFTQAYSGNTVYSPSRVSLFTGRDGRLMENHSNTVQLEATDPVDWEKTASAPSSMFGDCKPGRDMHRLSHDGATSVIGQRHGKIRVADFVSKPPGD